MLEFNQARGERGGTDTGRLCLGFRLGDRSGVRELGQCLVQGREPQVLLSDQMGAARPDLKKPVTIDGEFQRKPQGKL